MGQPQSASSPRATAHFRIKDWPSEERPREKLIRRGPEALSDAELLAILVRSGTGGASAIDIAREILVEEGSLRRLAQKGAPELMCIKGIGQAKAVELLAAFELGRRVETHRDEEKVVIRSPEDVAGIMIPKLRHATQEVFLVLMLDSKNAMRSEVEVTKGTLNASLVHPREIFRAAIRHLAASIIVVHNHPSGNPEPSREDIEVTKQLRDAGRLVGIPLHDHVIVAGDRYTSMAERGVL
jgi:DNA repair protein RadC